MTGAYIKGGFVTVGIKGLARNFDHRIVGIGFVVIGYCCKCHQLSSPLLFDHGRGQVPLLSDD
jgi:hypothetical protein